MCFRNISTFSGKSCNPYLQLFYTTRKGGHARITNIESMRGEACLMMVTNCFSKGMPHADSTGQAREASLAVEKLTIIGV